MNTYRHLGHVISERMNDGGSNVGFMFHRFAQALPGTMGVAVESYPHTIPVIERSIEENDLGNVRLVNSAVGDCVKASVEFQANLAISVEFRVTRLADNFETVAVSQITIDEILSLESGANRVFSKTDT
jgi:FkbM family methyltransferase